MTNQSFTAENFRDIFDYENRRGVYLEKEFFPEIKKLTDKIADSKRSIRDLYKRRSKLSKEEFGKEKAKLNEQKQSLRDQKESLLQEELRKLSLEVCGKGFRISLRAGPTIRQKKIYLVDKTPSAFFAIKQLQRNFLNAYKTRQGSRYQTVCQLSRILEDKYPKYVVRTDVQNFYESIPHNALLARLDSDALLTQPSRAHIKGILQDYKDLSGTSRGVPRGVGISAFLAELYMQELDRRIRQLPNLYFYARYVDDIVVVFSLGSQESSAGIIKSIRREAKAIGLLLSDRKTKPFNCANGKNHRFDYLGYRFSFGSGDLNIGLASTRRKRYVERLDKAFDEYQSRVRFDEKRAGSLLVKRVNFMTGNTRLMNNKRNIMVGVFHSNSCLTSGKELSFLDKRLRDRVKGISSATLKARLGKFSFEKGFSERRFQSYGILELSKIVRLWKNET